MHEASDKVKRVHQGCMCAQAKGALGILNEPDDESELPSTAQGRGVLRAGHCSWRGVGNGTHTEASFRRLGLREMLEHWTRPMRACNAHAARKLVRNAEHAGWDGIDRMGAKRLAAEESFSCGVGGRPSHPRCPA